MAKYNWEAFTKSSYFNELKKFFKELYTMWELQTDLIFVFISRRAFCMFLLMKKMECLNGWEDIKVYSDRYLMKSLDLDFLEGEKIVLVDDSLITGKHLRRSIQTIQERTKVSEIIPRIFAAEERWKLQPEFKITGKVKTVNWHILYSYSDILKLSSIESLLFYYCEIPYMIELPVLQDIQEKENSYSILFQKDEFELLKITFYCYLKCDFICPR